MSVRKPQDHQPVIFDMRTVEVSDEELARLLAERVAIFEAHARADAAWVNQEIERLKRSEGETP